MAGNFSEFYAISYFPEIQGTPWIQVLVASLLSQSFVLICVIFHYIIKVKVRNPHWCYWDHVCI